MITLHYRRPSAFTVPVTPKMLTPISNPMRTKAGVKFINQIYYDNKPAISSRHSIPCMFVLKYVSVC